VRQLNGKVKGGTEPYTYYSRELKREFCLFKMRWLVARSNQGMYRNNWRNDHFDFFNARFPNFEYSERFLRTTMNWWTKRTKYLTTSELAMLTSGCDGGRDSTVSTGTAGIGSEDIDAEQSQAGGGALLDASAADADAADAAPHREPGAQALALPAAAEGAFRPATLPCAAGTTAAYGYAHVTQAGAVWSEAVVGAWVGWSRAHAMAVFFYSGGSGGRVARAALQLSLMQGR
jgi:hypothetical protein